MPHFWVLVPTYNPGLQAWAQWIQALQTQNCKPLQVVVVDSGSTDGSLALSRQAGFTVLHTQAAQFNHGGTRQWALNQALQTAGQHPEFLVCLTQDAVLASHQALQTLLAAFHKPAVAAAYGRQLPKPGASWLEAHARLFNYPQESKTVQLQDKDRLGIKTCFLSNSFAAYRLEVLQQIGGFPNNLPLGEDTYSAAHFLNAGHHIAYQATASVYHSHNYNVRQDFQRMFDTGVFHAQNPWLLQTFGTAEDEGLRLLKSQWRYINQAKQNPAAPSLLEPSQPPRLTNAPQGLKPNLLLAIAQLLTTNSSKWVGYKLGRAYHYLPKFLLYKFAMHKAFWQQKT
jgi:rhamnosyltransferase